MSVKDPGTHAQSACVRRSLPGRRLRCASLGGLTMARARSTPGISRSFDDDCHRRLRRSNETSVLELAYSLAFPSNLIAQRPAGPRRWYSASDLRSWTEVTRCRVRVFGKRKVKRKARQSSCGCSDDVGCCSDKRQSLPRKRSDLGFNWDWKKVGPSAYSVWHEPVTRNNLNRSWWGQIRVNDFS